MSNQLASLQKGLIFRVPLSEWNPTRDEISGVVGTPTAVYNVLDRQGSGRRWLEYNGTSSYTTLPALTAFGTGDFTVIMKIHTNSLTTENIIGGADNSFGIQIISDGRIRTNLINTSDGTPVTVGIESNKDYIITYTRSSGTGTFYINGLAKSPVTDVLDYINSSTIIGGFNTTTYPFSGSISLVRIFNYALTPTQIANYSKPEYPIEWVDRGATGANLIIATDDRDFTIWGNVHWESYAGSITDGGGKATVTLPASGQGGFSIGAARCAVTVGKKYNLSFDLWRGTSASSTWFSQLGGVNYFGISVGTTQTKITTPIAPENVGALYILANSSDGGTAYLDNVSITQLGCVLDLNASGLSQSTSGYWYDRTNSTAPSYTSVAATNVNTTLVIPPASNLKGMYFNGTTSKVAFTGMNGLTGDITISCWVMLNSFGLNNLGRIFNNGTLNFQVYAGGYVITGRQTGTDVYSNGGAVSVNIPYNIIITCSGTSPYYTNIYINNVVSGGKNQTNTSPSSGTNYNIGNNINGVQTFDGLIYNINIWSRILDESQIKLVYDTGF